MGRGILRRGGGGDVGGDLGAECRVLRLDVGGVLLGAAVLAGLPPLDRALRDVREPQELEAGGDQGEPGRHQDTGAAAPLVAVAVAAVSACNSATAASMAPLTALVTTGRPCDCSVLTTAAKAASRFAVASPPLASAA